jgi:hypothetical protein
MNQTGVYGTGSPRHARMKGELWGGSGWVTRRVYRTTVPGLATRRLRSAGIVLVRAKIGMSPAM